MRSLERQFTVDTHFLLGLLIRGDVSTDMWPSTKYMDLFDVDEV